jgi:hypothetical protein
MRFLRTEREPDRLLDTVGDSLAALRGSVSKSQLLKAGLVAGGVAALTAGSAAISSLRRRLEGVEG